LEPRVVGVLANRVEDRLHEVLKVSGLHEDSRLLSQARSAGALPLKRGRGDGLRVSLSHGSQSSFPLGICLKIALATVYARKAREAKRFRTNPLGRKVCG